MRLRVTISGKVMNDSELAKAIQLKFKDKDLHLEVRCDRTVPYGRVAQVIGMAQKNGALKLSFVTIGDKTQK